MKRSLTSLLLAALAIGFAAAYDFESGGIYYTILSEENQTVAVACGNTSSETEEAASLLNGPMRIQGYDYYLWEGNSYTGDVVVPETVQMPGTEKTYTVAAVDMGAFWNCRTLTSVSLPSTLRSIGPGAFSNCMIIEEIIVPDEVTEVGENAFMCCPSLRHVHYPLGCNSLPVMAFEQTGAPEGLEVTGTENVVYVWYWVFRGSTLKKFPEFKKIKYMEFSTFANTPLETVDFPAGCVVGHNIFMDCKELTSITIPAGMLTPAELFEHNENLRLIRYYEPTPPEIFKSIAAQVAADCVLEVPAESVEAYREATYWKDFAEIRAIADSGVATPAGGELNVLGGQGQIILSGIVPVEVYNMSAQKVYSGCEGTIVVPAGIYLVKAGGRTMKVVVN